MKPCNQLSKLHLLLNQKFLVEPLPPPLLPNQALLTLLKNQLLSWMRKSLRSNLTFKVSSIPKHLLNLLRERSLNSRKRTAARVTKAHKRTLKESNTSRLESHLIWTMIGKSNSISKTRLEATTLATKSQELSTPSELAKLWVQLSSIPLDSLVDLTWPVDTPLGLTLLIKLWRKICTRIITLPNSPPWPSTKPRSTKITCHHRPPTNSKLLQFPNTPPTRRPPCNSQAPPTRRPPCNSQARSNFKWRRTSRSTTRRTLNSISWLTLKLWKIVTNKVNSRWRISPSKTMRCSNLSKRPNTLSRSQSSRRLL